MDLLPKVCSFGFTLSRYSHQFNKSLRARKLGLAHITQEAFHRSSGPTGITAHHDTFSMIWLS
jgi:hypothetical protein